MEPRHSSPGRPRSFDRGSVLDAAVDAFHANGLAGTTYDTLERVTGLRRQSLVYAFGDKRALFEAALNRYADRRIGNLVACLSAAGSPAEAIRAAFDSWLDDARDTAHPGCLLVNSAVEVDRSDGSLTAIVDAATERLLAAFEAAFVRADGAGELRSTARPADLARLAVSLGDGALLHARRSGSAKLAEAGFRAFLATTLR